MNHPTDTTEPEAPGLAIRVSQLSQEVGHLREIVRCHGFEIRAFHGRFEAAETLLDALAIGHLIDHPEDAPSSDSDAMAIAHIIDHSHDVPATDIIDIPQDAPSTDSRTSEEADEVSEDPTGQNKEVEATETTPVSLGPAPATKADVAELLTEIRQVQKQIVVVTEL
ncbi:unnamed protein product [Penicillium pancosmium]